MNIWIITTVIFGLWAGGATYLAATQGVDVEQTQVQNVRNEQTQNAYQVQITVVLDAKGTPHRVYNVNVEGVTNVELVAITNGITNGITDSGTNER